MSPCVTRPSLGPVLDRSAVLPPGKHGQSAAQGHAHLLAAVGPGLQQGCRRPALPLCHHLSSCPVLCLKRGRDRVCAGRGRGAGPPDRWSVLELSLPRVPSALSSPVSRFDVTACVPTPSPGENGRCPAVRAREHTCVPEATPSGGLPAPEAAPHPQEPHNQMRRTRAPEGWGPIGGAVGCGDPGGAGKAFMQTKTRAPGGACGLRPGPVCPGAKVTQGLSLMHSPWDGIDLHPAPIDRPAPPLPPRRGRPRASRLVPGSGRLLVPVTQGEGRARAALLPGGRRAPGCSGSSCDSPVRGAGLRGVRTRPGHTEGAEPSCVPAPRGVLGTDAIPVPR